MNNGGRPTFFRVYSATDGDPASVLALAERVAEIDRQAIADGGLDDPYATPPAPAIALESGRCLVEPRAIDGLRRG